MLDRRIRIVNRLGLHARAAAKLVRLAAKFESSVTLAFNDTSANAKSILDVLALAAGYGKTVEIVVDGPDAEDAMTQIEQLFLDGFDEI